MSTNKYISNHSPNSPLSSPPLSQSPSSTPYVTDESEDDDDSITVEVPEDFDDDEKMSFSGGCKQVTFALSFNQVIEIPSRETFSAEEISSAWYNKADYQAIKRRALQTIQLQRAGNLVSEDEHCMRGLEGRTNGGYSIVKSNRSQASYAVIDEQDRQDEMGISDSDLLAEVYQSSSLHCKCVAFARALVDAQEVAKDILSLAATGGAGQAVFSADTSEGEPQRLNDGQLSASSGLTQVPVKVDQAPDGAVLVLFLATSNSNTSQEERYGDMVVEPESSSSLLQSNGYLQEDVNDSMDMEWTAAEA